MSSFVMPTEFLSVAEQATLITEAQDVPVFTELDEEGTEIVRYGTTPASERALERLTTAFLPVINKEARRSKVQDPEDALATLLLEFVATVRRHDVDSPVPFSKTIGTILSRAISDSDRTSDLVAVKESVAVYYWRLLHRHDGDLHSAYEEAKTSANGISPATFLAVHNVVSGIDSLDLAAAEGTEKRYAFVSSQPSHEDVIALEAEVEWLFTLVTERQSSILRLAYGFLDDATETVRVENGFRIGELLTDAQTAHVLDITRPTAQRDRVKALAAMRDALVALEQLDHGGDE